MAKNGFKVLDSDMHILEPPTFGSDISIPSSNNAPRGHDRSCEGLATGGPPWRGMGPTGGPASGNHSAARSYLSPESETF